MYIAIVDPIKLSKNKVKLNYQANKELMCIENKHNMCIDFFLCTFLVSDDCQIYRCEKLRNARPVNCGFGLTPWVSKFFTLQE